MFTPAAWFISSGAMYCTVPWPPEAKFNLPGWALPALIKSAAVAKGEALGTVISMGVTPTWVTGIRSLSAS